jgi:hypothetical protein
LNDNSNFENKILLMKAIDIVNEEIEFLKKANNLDDVNFGITKIF